MYTSLLMMLACRTSSTKPDDGIIKDSTISDTALPTEESTPTEDSSSEPSATPDEVDSDNDGLTDIEEEEIGTDPSNPDSDDDGLNDSDEVRNGTDPNDSDSDNDGLTDRDEGIIGTDPNNADSDDDGLNDGDEVANGTNPNDDDTDGDGISDGEEFANGTDPNDDGLDDDTGDFWDWGDNPNSNCPDCDPTQFTGAYEVNLLFISAIGSTQLCSQTEQIYFLSNGGFTYSTSCTTTTGANFDFIFDLSATYFNQYASADRACLEGSAQVTLPNGTIIQENFNSQDCPGAVGDPTNGFVIGSSYTYCELCFAWYPQITSPNGTVPYTIAFYGNKL